MIRLRTILLLALAVALAPVAAADAAPKFGAGFDTANEFIHLDIWVRVAGAARVEVRIAGSDYHRRTDGRGRLSCTWNRRHERWTPVIRMHRERGSLWHTRIRMDDGNPTGRSAAVVAFEALQLFRFTATDRRGLVTVASAPMPAPEPCTGYPS